MDAETVADRRDGGSGYEFRDSLFGPRLPRVDFVVNRVDDLRDRLLQHFQVVKFPQGRNSRVVVPREYIDESVRLYVYEQFPTTEVMGMF